MATFFVIKYNVVISRLHHKILKPHLFHSQIDNFRKIVTS